MTFSSSFSIYRCYFFLFFDLLCRPENHMGNPAWKLLTYSWHKSILKIKIKRETIITYVIMKFYQLIKSKLVFAGYPSCSFIHTWFIIRFYYNFFIFKIFNFPLEHFSDHHISCFSWNITDFHNMNFVFVFLFW